jgi:5-methylcytosine-specific restriction protein A
LRPVCPNCHAMLHTSDPPLEIEDLRQRLQQSTDT